MPARARDLEQALARSSVFAGVDEATIAALATSAKRRAWDGGTVLFQRGDAGEYLLALTSGRVRLSVSTPNGKELVLRHMGPGEVIGEFSLIDGQPRSADATVVQPSAGIVLYRDRFMRMAETHPQLGLALARHLCQQLRSTNYQMESIALYDLRARVARFLLYALHEQHGATASGRTRLRMVLNQSELALLLGASRPKVNQVLQLLLAEGALEREGETLICDIAQLEDAVEVPEHGLL
ncbi:MAG: Crp/Fnr family transcriptional regulator [Rubellimicrobium sp.]|nr:Crp/Fnr family transcriptional regulator [Rubellimicrobium sp.]